MFEFLLIADLAGFFLGLLGVILFLISFFLVFIILIQRGKGGGIAGSLTGTAQSAFGARGGDILMWLTLSLTIIWILLCCVTIFFFSRVQDSIAEGKAGADIQEAAAAEIGLPAADLNAINDNSTTITSPSPARIETPADDRKDEGPAEETAPGVKPPSEDEGSESANDPPSEGAPATDEPESPNAPENAELNDEATSGDQG